MLSFPFSSQQIKAWVGSLKFLIKKKNRFDFKCLLLNETMLKGTCCLLSICKVKHSVYLLALHQASTWPKAKKWFSVHALWTLGNREDLADKF